MRPLRVQDDRCQTWTSDEHANALLHDATSRLLTAVLLCDACGGKEQDSGRVDCLREWQGLAWTQQGWQLSPKPLAACELPIATCHAARSLCRARNAAQRRTREEERMIGR